MRVGPPRSSLAYWKLTKSSPQDSPPDPTGCSPFTSSFSLRACSCLRYLETTWLWAGGFERDPIRTAQRGHRCGGHSQELLLFLLEEGPHEPW